MDVCCFFANLQADTNDAISRKNIKNPSVPSCFWKKITSEFNQVSAASQDTGTSPGLASLLYHLRCLLKTSQALLRWWSQLRLPYVFAHSRRHWHRCSCLRRCLCSLVKKAMPPHLRCHCCIPAPDCKVHCHRLERRIPHGGTIHNCRFSYLAPCIVQQMRSRQKVHHILLIALQAEQHRLKKLSAVLPLQTDYFLVHGLELYSRAETPH